MIDFSNNKVQSKNEVLITEQKTVWKFQKIGNRCFLQINKGRAMSLHGWLVIIMNKKFLKKDLTLVCQLENVGSKIAVYSTWKIYPIDVK